MNRNKILIIFLYLSFIFLSAQDLEQKKQQLEKLKKEISNQENIILEKEAKKKQSEKSLKSTLQSKDKTDKEITNLTRKEQMAKKKLDSTISNLNNTSENLKQLNKLCEQEYNLLFQTHFLGLISPAKDLEAHLLADLLVNTVNEIFKFSNRLNVLESDKETKNRKYEDFIWSRIVAKKKLRKYDDQISQLEVNIDQYNIEKEQALVLKQQFENEASSLDELISKLQSDYTSNDYSYTFSTPKLIWPAKGEIIRYFGIQKHDNYKVTLKNNGIDIALEKGTPIKAVEDGVVAYAEWYEGAGKLVILNHQNGFYSLYSHNSRILVSKGDSINKNQEIALSGQTGSTEVPCLHFELRKRGTPVNPLEYLE